MTGRTITIELQPEMAHEILRLLRNFRAEPFEEIGSPLQVSRALRREKELRERTFLAIMRAILAGQAPILDGDLLEAVDAMQAAHDRAKARTNQEPGTRNQELLLCVSKP